MPRPLARSLLAAVLALSPVAVRAGLEFESTDLSLKPALGEKRVRAEFVFKNTGSEPVTITRVQSGCGCTVPEKPTEPVAPGAKGVIPVVFKAEGRQGPQNQHIVVETSDGKTHDLKLSLDLPVRVSFAPRLLLFRGDSAEPKSATLTYAAEAKVELLGVFPQNPSFEVVNEPVLDNNVLKIEVRHIGAADAETRGSVRVRTRDAGGEEHIDLLYVRHSP